MASAKAARSKSKRVPVAAARRLSPGPVRCRRKFLRFFPNGFRDETYLDWERDYKAQAHERWQATLDPVEYAVLMNQERFIDIANRAVSIESRTNLLFSFEKMALRDAVKSQDGARAFAIGLYDLLEGSDPLDAKFERWRDVVADLPRRQTRVLTWPVLTVFPFIARPGMHFFLKPNVTRTAAREYGFELEYSSRPSWATYASVLNFAETVRRDLRDLRPRDMIDLQSFIWVQGSDEYDE